MGWPSLLVIMSSSFLFFAKITVSLTVNYVKPLVNMTASPCPDEQTPCLTLGEYTSDSNMYFVNNTIFYFYPGDHTLDDRLILENLYNFSFQSLPNADQIVNVSVNSSASITWKESWNIEISSIRFTLNDHFTFIMKFEHSQIVHLSNISIFGNGYRGCSSVLIQESAVFINNSVFTEINGFLGAAVMMVASNVTFRGNNTFVDNIAISGGSIYLSDSISTFSGTSLFLNNTFSGNSKKVIKKRRSLCNIVENSKLQMIYRRGGAILCTTSYLGFYEYSNFIGNSALRYGGAIAMVFGALTIQGNASFDSNKAQQGGAMFLTRTNTNFSGNIYLIKNKANDGGAIWIYTGELIIQGNASFDSSKAQQGGAMFLTNTNTNFSGNIYLNKNNASDGGAIWILKGELIVQGNASFDSNKARQGGAMFLTKTNTNFSGNIYLNKNKASDGGAIWILKGELIIQGNASFDSNKARRGGAMLLTKTNTNFSGNIYLNKNKAGDGGAIWILEGKLIIQGNAIFDGNFAADVGGALYILFTKVNFYGNNSAIIRRGEVYTSDHESKTNECFTCTVRFDNSITFLNNTAGSGGSIFCEEECDVEFIGTVYFTHNTGSAVFLNKHSSITFTGDTYFYRNTGYVGGAIHCYYSNNIITLSGTVYFEGNVGYHGGALFLTGTSKLVFTPKLDIFFISNHANDSGGALYFEDYHCPLESTVECFITIDSPISTTCIKNISLHFENNSAGATGSILYGGQFDKCRLFVKSSTEQPDPCGYKPPSYSDYSKNALETLINMLTIVQNDSEDFKLNLNDTVLVSSPASKIRYCGVDNVYNKFVDLFRKVYPGQHFNISLMALGQTGHPVPTTVFWEKDTEMDSMGISEYRLSPQSQTVESSCTPVSFQLYSGNVSFVRFKLYLKSPCQKMVKELTLFIHVLPCPIGFNLSLRNSRCVCDKKLKKLTQNCYIGSNSEYVERMKNSFWIYKTTNESLILHEYRCPLDYCKATPQDKISLSDPSVQCDFNRNGIVCGKCQKKFSLALGSLHCIPCDNKHTALILFFTMAGIALIALIFLLRLTVPAGTLGGLFFYANIVQANHQAFFPRATINFFTVFISWLNLDLGIETCFYDGMDIYAYSWLQFLFPFYLWFLVGCIIVIYRHSQSIAKRFGQNPVAVLATLYLMSYSKLLQAIIVPLSLTYLTHYTPSNETQSIVWLYDASIDYFGEPKHIALGLFAVASVVVFVLPYILLLFFGHWLQGCSNWWILSWLNKLKPFMDAYHAPYKKHTRYWTGLLLLSRLGLFLTFAINANGSESVNILAVSSVAIALLAIHKRVYERRWKDLLECSFILNLGIFSVATFYLKEESEDANSQLILSSISVGTAFITFIGILLFHSNLVFKSSSIWKVHILPFIQRSLLLSKILRITPVTKDKNTTGDKDAAELQALPTSTEIDVDLREPLLEISES